MPDVPYQALLAARRAELVQRAHDQRQDLALRALPLVQAGGWVDRGVAAWRTMRAHPWAVVAPLAALAIWRPRGVLRALPVVLTLWRVIARRHPS
jgi:YqjK-like protein